MSTMRDAVHERVEKLRSGHERRKGGRHGYLVRPVTLTIGWLVVIVGLITIPLPGQGWLTTFFGVGILSLEVNWARRLLDWGIAQYDRFFEWYHRQSRWVRYALIALLVVVIWAIFAGMFYGSWASGSLGFADSFFQRLGIVR